ncbi:MAG: division/cell wall cluster transcriptional repressor MraZ [Ardenticatenaceae bacterium]|nr:division/cell wall cluster transcriptional repressor MraZ [Ardenticatenaceae bacterium]HBY97778.1 cell division/cell wall cluster transcriptional repressor MraZ [Chloroflexota bacterium]
MFVGEYAHSIDSKGRLTVPAKFRQDFEAGLVMTAGLDHCLWIFTREGWERFAGKLGSLPSGKADARTLTRFFFSQASDSVPDRQGRVLVPENLRQLASLDGDAIIVGVNDRLEVWEPKAWGAFKSEQQANLTTIAEELGDFGI